MTYQERHGQKDRTHLTRERAARLPLLRIEYPCQGATYCRPEFGVYEYSTYSPSSVLAGQDRRVFLDAFNTLAEARAAYPSADVPAHL